MTPVITTQEPQISNTDEHSVRASAGRPRYARSCERRPKDAVRPADRVAADALCFLWLPVFSVVFCVL